MNVRLFSFFIDDVDEHKSQTNHQDIMPAPDGHHARARWRAGCVWWQLAARSVSMPVQFVVTQTWPVGEMAITLLTQPDSCFVTINAHLMTNFSV